MPFEMWVGFRYLMSKRSSIFVSFIAIMTVLGVVVGVAALNVTLAVMTGFEDDLKSKIIGMKAHAVVVMPGSTFARDEQVEKQILETKGVLALTPFTHHELLIQSGANVTGILLRGTDPATVGDVTDLVRSICLEKDGNPCGEGEGRLDERQAIMDGISNTYEINDGTKSVPGVILGSDLASQLLVRTGETVQLLAPALGEGPGGTMFPKVRTFYVAGMFETGMPEYDQKTALSGIEAAQKISGDEGHIAGLEIKTDDVYAAPKIALALTSKLGGSFRAQSWAETNGALFSALRLEKFVMSLLLSIIVIVASFSIVSVLTLVVLEKAKEIAILKSTGASNAMILGVFAVQGFAIGLTGVALGSLLGYGLSAYLRWLEFDLNTEVYFPKSVPVVISWENFLAVGVSGLLITFAAGLLPSFVAARQKPVLGLQYD